MNSIIEDARTWAVSEIEQFGLPALGHFEISERVGLELAQNLGANADIVHLGLCLMDYRSANQDESKLWKDLFL